MYRLEKIQLNINKQIANKNKKHIIKKLTEYYNAINYNEQINAKAFAIYWFWIAKKQGRLDNLNRIVKNSFKN